MQHYVYHAAPLWALGLLRWHFSPQYFTSSQELRHFLRYSKGRPQVRQILVGRFPLVSLAGTGITEVKSYNQNARYR